MPTPTHKPRVQFGLRTTKWNGSLGVCQTEKCTQSLKDGQLHFYDRIADRDLCHQCGEILRYHRKKAAQRGEHLPRTQKQVDEMFDRIFRKRRRA